MNTPSAKFDLRAVLAAMRPTQWTKNLLVAAAFFFACGDPDQAVHPAEAAITVGLAILLFCLTSSGIYIINDLRDVESDRVHPIKRLRPIAAGRLAPGHARIVSVLLLGTGLAGAVLLSPAYAVVIAAYIVLQLAYTFGLKRVALVDVMMIAFGFVLRAIGGGVVVGVAISPWLLLCTFLLAMFLALCKRRHEKLLAGPDDPALHRRNLTQYDAKLLDLLIAVIAAATIVCYALYTLWPETVAKFGTSALGFTIPFVIFGIFRYMDLVYRHEEGGRPEKILLSDLPILLNALLYAVTVAAICLLRR